MQSEIKCIRPLSAVIGLKSPDKLHLGVSFMSLACGYRSPIQAQAGAFRPCLGGCVTGVPVCCPVSGKTLDLFCSLVPSPVSGLSSFCFSLSSLNGRGTQLIPSLQHATSHALRTSGTTSHHEGMAWALVTLHSLFMEHSHTCCSLTE